MIAFFFFRALSAGACNPSAEGCWLLCSSCFNVSHFFRGFLTKISAPASQPAAEKLEVRSWCTTKHHLKPCPCLPLLRAVSHRRTRDAAPDRDGVLCTVRQGTPSSGSPSPSCAALNSVLKAPFSAPTRLCRRSSQHMLGSSGQQLPAINMELIRKYLMKVHSDLLMEESYPWRS